MKRGDKVGTATVLSVSSPKVAHKPRPNHPVAPSWAVSSSGWWAIQFRPACRVVSEANRHDGWAEAMRRRKAQQKAVRAAWLTAPWGLHKGWQFPCVVTLTHHGPKMDKHDNLSRAFKGIVDAVAGLLGIDDGDDRVTWEYRQTTDGEPGVVVRVEART